MNLTRRKLLAASGLLAAAVGAETAAEAATKLAEPLDRAAGVASGRAAADAAMIADLDRITVAFEHAYRTMAGALLAEPLRAHIDTLKAVLQQAMLPEQRQALLRTASHATALMACRQFSDHSDRQAARGWLAESIEFGETTDDPNLHVLGVVRAAEQHLYTGHPDRGLQFLGNVRGLAERRGSPATQAWVLVSQAEANAAMGQAQECPRLLGLAEEAQARARPSDEPAWLDYWGQFAVAGYAGAVYMRLGKPGKARVALHAALAGTSPSMLKSQSIHLVDLATTYAQEFEVEAACELAGKALDLAGPMHYGNTLERMAGLRQRLARMPKVPAVRDLDERLRAARST